MKEEERVQEVMVSAESEEGVKALDEGSLDDGPLTAQEGEHHQQSEQAMACQRPMQTHRSPIYNKYHNKTK